MNRILVTGGSGFIGTNIVEYYRAQGHEVLSADVAEPRHPDHRPFWKELDVTDGRALEKLMCEFRPEYVFHLAARTDLEGNDVAEYHVNTSGVANMLSEATRTPPKRIVFASSMLVCALGYRPRNETDYCPPNPYGQSKVIAEKQIRAILPTNLPWIIVRPTSIWGPWFDVPYSIFFNLVRTGYYVHPGTIAIKRSLGFVGNTVYQFDRLVRADPAKTVGCTFYLSDYPATEIRLWAELIRKEFGAPPIKRFPVMLVKAVALAGDAFKKCGFRNVPLTSTRLRNLMTEAIIDLANLHAICGELPFDLPQGVKLTAAWLQSHQAP